MSEPKVEPLIRAARKVYRQSKVYELDQLLAEESRWKRKVTIATNKLAEVRNKINDLAKAAVQPASCSAPSEDNNERTK